MPGGCARGHACHATHSRIARDLVRVRQVDLQRRDRHAVRRDRVEIGARPGVLRRARGADPVHHLAARILDLHDALGLVTLAEPGDLDAAQRLERDVRHVDVEQHRMLDRLGLEPPDDVAGNARRSGKVAPGLARERQRHRRDAEEKTLGGRGDGARIDRVVAHVRAEVDAGDDEVRQLVEEAGHRQVHAIGRRAVHEQEPVGGAPHRERAVERQRIGGAAAIALRRDHRDFAQIGQCIGEMRETRREVAVVVGEEDAHPATPSGPENRGRTRCVVCVHRAPGL